MEVREGGLTVEVPEQEDQGTGDGVFYNPEQELNRDLTVATLRAYRERGRDSDYGGDRGGEHDDVRDPDRNGGYHGDVETYLDATAASGIRGVRAAAEGFEATCCDVDPDAVALAERNFARNDLEGTAVHRDANALMHESRFDVVDADPFGTPIPFIDAASNCTRHLLCVTATDTAPLCGAHFESGVRTYGAVPQNTEFHPEMGLRVLLSALVRTTARYDVAATPILSHVANHYARTYLALETGARAADDRIAELGYVDWCPACLYRESDRGLIANPLEACPHCGATTKTAGPLWLGPAHDRDFVRPVREHVTGEMGTADRARGVLDRLADELDTPTHYDTHRLFEQWGTSAIGMAEFVETLRAAGFGASRTHYGGTTVKTTADVAEMAELFAPDL